MDVKKAIEDRRSIRKYADKEVSDDMIKELIEAARLAPSGNNAQPWKYMVIKKEMIEKLKENKIFKQNFVYKAPVIIVCCADPKAYPRAKFESAFDDPYEARALRDLSISCQNLVLQAVELGLGTCYIGWMNKEKIKEILNIPEEFVIPYVITIGWPAEQPDARDRKDIDEIVI